ncbi:MAG: J domain-containing protein, partial [Deltaproteobacteria bacterium]|nr:J domain-containing protein [Deltaproteobacteria bacterium]
MSVTFQDYYKTLGVDKNATPQEIQKAYRKAARKFHPDLNKDKNAESKFKEINEANEVLSDPEKRKRYDLLGANYRDGQEFRPPPGWEQAFRGGNGGGSMHFDSFSGFSDFFDLLFGGNASFQAGGGGGGATFEQLFGGAEAFQNSARGNTGRRPTAAMREEPAQELELPLSIEELYHGGQKPLQIESVDPSGGTARRTVKTYQVKIPAGVTEGGVIRLAGQGAPSGSGRNGDLLLKIKIQDHPRFRVDGFDVIAPLQLSPWEAALGSKVNVATVDG